MIITSDDKSIHNTEQIDDIFIGLPLEDVRHLRTGRKKSYADLMDLKNTQRLGMSGGFEVRATDRYRVFSFFPAEDLVPQTNAINLISEKTVEAFHNKDVYKADLSRIVAKSEAVLQRLSKGNDRLIQKLDLVKGLRSAVVKEVEECMRSVQKYCAEYSESLDRVERSRGHNHMERTMAVCCSLDALHSLNRAERRIYDAVVAGLVVGKIYRKRNREYAVFGKPLFLKTVQRIMAQIDLKN